MTEITIKWNLRTPGKKYFIKEGQTENLVWDTYLTKIEVLERCLELYKEYGEEIQSAFDATHDSIIAIMKDNGVLKFYDESIPYVAAWIPSITPATVLTQCIEIDKLFREDKD